MPFLFFIPLIVCWVVTYWVLKYPVQPVGRMIARLSPNGIVDAGISIILTHLGLGLIIAVVVYTQDYLTHEPYPYPMDDRATIVASVFGLPIFLAIFKGARHARSGLQAR